jgi:hypothetical protein
MKRTISVSAVLLAAALLAACGTSSRGPDGSFHQATTGVSSTGFPAGEPKDAGSPALASSTESQYSRDQSEEAKPEEKDKK